MLVEPINHNVFRYTRIILRKQATGEMKVSTVGTVQDVFSAFVPEVAIEINKKLLTDLRRDGKAIFTGPDGEFEVQLCNS